MLNIGSVNRYFLRLQALPERPEVSGQVIYLRQITKSGMVVSLVDDCRPRPNLIRLSPQSNDEGWYDATELILAANCAITPRYDLCTFVNDTAKQYRNHLEDRSVFRICDSTSATGKLCFVGKFTGKTAELSPQACFVVSTDDYGFSIVYNGFCNPHKKKSDRHKLTQRILRLEGSGQSFFEAAPIVAECNKLYDKDIALKEQYVNAAKDRVASRSTDTTQAQQNRHHSDGLTGMKLS